MGLIKFLFWIAVLGAIFGAGYWALTTPQPIRFETKLAYLKDTAQFEWERFRDKEKAPRDLKAEFTRWKPMADAGNIAAGLHVAETAFKIASNDPRAYALALHYVRPLADKGIPKAQNVLGVMTLKGLGGLAVDKVEAYKWFNLASDRGDNQAYENMLRLSSEMSSAEVLEGEHRSNTWVLDKTGVSAAQLISQ